MTKDDLLNVAAICLGAILGTSLTILANVSLNNLWQRASSPLEEVVSEQPVVWSLEESLVRGANEVNFDIDISEDYKRGWKDCCEFLITRMEKPHDH